MKKLERHIGYLLSRYDILTLPGLGTFVYTYHPACFDEEGYEVTAPSKSLVFCEEEYADNDLLIASVSKSFCISAQKANELVSEEITILREKLKQYGNARIGCVGELFFSVTDGAICFTPDDKFIDVETAWLPRIELRHQETTIKVVESLSPEFVPESSWHKFIRVAASIAALIGFFFLVSTPIAIDDSLSASFFPEVRKMEAIDVVPHNQEQTCDVVTADVISNVEAEPVETAETDVAEEIAESVVEAHIPSEPIVTPAAVTPIENGRYCVIVASLATLEDAEQFISQHSEDNLGILSKDGRHRVYCGSYSTSSEAQAAVSTLSDRYTSAWVCAR